MSKALINQYYNQLDRAIQFSKSKNEDTIKSYFWMLLNDYAHRQNYEVVREVYCMGTKGSKVKPDGILKTLWGIDVGYWESKDEKDSIEDEIDAKQRKGYPMTNILFEDSKTAVLIQRGEEVLRADVRKAEELDKILKEFISFKNETVYQFEDAIEKFKADIPNIIEVLRKRIEESGIQNTNYISVRNSFLELCKAEINPEFTLADVREMMIQHILTSDIFNKIFDDPEFHRHNTIAAELEKLIGTLFTYAERKNLLGDIEHYYDTINATAAGIADHHEKQKFLKVLYENFYKVYNPKAADRLGVVYTPNEIVKFMIESTDYLLGKHFNKTLADKNVEILDPATGTGTFICDIIEHIPKQHLAYKYKNELHANDVAILPYYIANLNIEFTFKQKMGYYEEFVNSCFVDTLDSTGALAYTGKQNTLFGLSSENAERIKKQNSKKISVIIGNPPYNANQRNFNDFNKNREYPSIDKRIKDTYIKESNAQKTKLYDMYSRFFRWASDRIENEGIVCFVSNNSFIRKDSFDGFRKIVSKEFSDLYIIDLVGDLRDDKEGNVFGVKVGVSISFFIKRKETNQYCRIKYYRPPQKTKPEKLEFLSTNSFDNVETFFKTISPNKDSDWINFSENDYSALLPLHQKGLKETLFLISSNAVSTNRDEWVYDSDEGNLHTKIKYFIKRFNDSVNNREIFKDIKWSETLRSHFNSGKQIKYNSDLICESLYRPFVKEFLYFDKKISDRLTDNHFTFLGATLNEENRLIAISSGQRGEFGVIGTKFIPNLDIFMPNGTRVISLYCYDKEGLRSDSITNWGLNQFQQHYYLSKEANREAYISGYFSATGKKESKKGTGLEFPGIQKEDIFHYTYAVLHHPAYRKKYELNLKREFPRIPFYDNFWQWAEWGRQLMDLHINYETVTPYGLKLHQHEQKAEAKKQKEIFSKLEEPQALYGRQPKIKTKLKADKAAGIIELDELSFLTGIPKEAWEYKLGNRSALEWILDQYKEKKPKDPTIAEKFNTYRFADYKEKVIDLLKRVCTVSVETMKIVNAMPD